MCVTGATIISCSRCPHSDYAPGLYVDLIDRLNPKHRWWRCSTRLSRRNLKGSDKNMIGANLDDRSKGPLCSSERVLTTPSVGMCGSDAERFPGIRNIVFYLVSTLSINVWFLCLRRSRRHVAQVPRSTKHHHAKEDLSRQHTHRQWHVSFLCTLRDCLWRARPSSLLPVAMATKRWARYFVKQNISTLRGCLCGAAELHLFVVGVVEVRSRRGEWTLVHWEFALRFPGTKERSWSARIMCMFGCLCESNMGVS